MKRIAALLSALGLLFGASLLRRSGGEFDVGTPWSPRLVELVALGRRDAGADLEWLKAVQTIGNLKAERSGFPGLIDRLEVVSALAPDFAATYLVGGTLLVARPSVTVERLDALLARGEAALPKDFRLPLTRGFVAYFSQVDPATAAAHYRRASRLPLAPPYLVPFAERLAKSQGCRALIENLQAAGEMAGQREGAMLDRSAERIVFNCIENEIRRAAATYRARYERAPDGVDDLVTEGMMPAPYAPPGQCWQIYPAPHLEACP